MKRLLVVGLATLAFAAPSAEAQRSQHPSTPIELGIDGGIIFGLDQPRATIVTLPVQSFRVGFFVNDRLEVEPRFNLNSLHGGGQSVSTYNLELGVLYQPNGERVVKGLYGRPFIGVTGSSASPGGSNNNGYFGFGLGAKLPFADRRMATRLEANYSHGFSGGINEIDLLFGLSFFTR